jgi:hypothetical protein
MERKQLFQQGDVLMFRTDELPKEAKPKKFDEKVVLAIGEATGHSHTMVADDVDAYEDANGTLWLVVKKDGAVVDHQEHGKVTLPKGTFEVKQVVEFDPFQEAIRKVTD